MEDKLFSFAFLAAHVISFFWGVFFLMFVNLAITVEDGNKQLGFVLACLGAAMGILLFAMPVTVKYINLGG